MKILAIRKLLPAFVLTAILFAPTLRLSAQQPEPSTPATGAASTPAAQSPEAAVLAGERRQELLVAIDRLADDDRAVITLRWLAELSEREMAAMLDVPAGTVKSRLSRAMERLRSAMAGDADDG